MTSPLAHLAGQTLLGATHDVDARWVSSPELELVAAVHTLRIDYRAFLGIPTDVCPLTISSAPELEVWRHRDGGRV